MIVSTIAVALRNAPETQKDPVYPKKVEASWEVIDGEFHGVNHHELIRLLTTKDEERLGAK